MGICCDCKNVTLIPKDPEYIIPQLDEWKRYLIDRQVNVKLEPKILNIDSKNSCQIELIIFTNKEKTSFKKGGITENGTVDPENNIMNFSKFFIMDYLFEKEQPIEFIITGSIEARIRTSLAYLMGSKGHIFHKKIKEDDDMILEIQGYSYDKKLISTLNINISMKGELKKKDYAMKYMLRAQKKINKIYYYIKVKE